MLIKSIWMSLVTSTKGSKEEQHFYLFINFTKLVVMEPMHIHAQLFTHIYTKNRCVKSIINIFMKYDILYLYNSINF